MIQLSNIQFRYNRNAPLLFNELSLDLKPGNIYGLLGKNGAGKTSLLKIMCGLLFAKDGQAVVLNFAAQQRNPEMLSDIYFIPEDIVAPSMSPISFVNTYKSFYPRFSADTIKELMTEYSLDSKQNLRKMSYGQRKKFFIAFGLATNTRLLILDEPTNGLDIPSKSQFRKMVSSQMNDEKTIIVSTHQVRDLQSLIDPIIVLDSGKIVFQQSIENIQQKVRFDRLTDDDKPDDIIYAERTTFGGHYLAPYKTGKPSAIDIELLFNAIMDEPAKINAFFN